MPYVPPAHHSHLPFFVLDRAGRIQLATLCSRFDPAQRVVRRTVLTCLQVADTLGYVRLRHGRACAARGGACSKGCACGRGRIGPSSDDTGKPALQRGQSAFSLLRAERNCTALAGSLRQARTSFFVFTADGMKSCSESPAVRRTSETAVGL